MVDTARVWAAELALLDPAVRRDRAAVDALLAEGFEEIGQSGRRWSREEILDLLADDEPIAADPVVSGRRTRLLPDGLVLLISRLELGGRGSLRSSLWEADPPRLVFHQGTPVARG